MATVEYTALAFVVSAVLAVGGGVVDARAVPDAVGAQLRRAYCVVAGGDCLGRAGPRPCVVGTRSRAREARILLGLGRLRDGRIVRREVRADGTVLVTVIGGSGAGVAAQLGFSVRAGGRRFGGEVEAQGGGDAAFGRTYLAADVAAADRLMRRLEDAEPPVGSGVAGLVRFLRSPPADEVSRTATLGSRVDAEAALKALGMGGEARALAGATFGVRLDHRSGDRTALLRFPREVTAQLTSPLARIGVGAGEGVEVELAFHRGMPAELLVRARAAGAADDRGRVVEGELRLDLADPEARALVRRVGGGDLGAAGALATRLAERARVDTRVLAITRDESTKGGSLKLLGGVGGEIVATRETTELLDARGREPGQAWGPRLDCGVAIAGG